MTTLILVRHGETEANAQQLCHGALEAPLTPRGQYQGRATAQRIAELATQYPIDILYVSPLSRTYNTAQTIAQVLHLIPVVEEGLRELSLGDWEGRSFTDLITTEQLLERWRVDPGFAPPNGESLGSFQRRAVAALQDLADRHRGQTVLAVTHGGVIRTVLATWLDGDPSDWLRWESHNCAITILQQRGDRWHPILINEISHLPAETIVRETPMYAAVSRASEQ